METKPTEAYWVVTILAVIAVVMVAVSIYICAIMINSEQTIDRTGFGSPRGETVQEIPCRYVNQAMCR